MFNAHLPTSKILMKNYQRCIELVTSQSPLSVDDVNDTIEMDKVLKSEIFWGEVTMM